LHHIWQQKIGVQAPSLSQASEVFYTNYLFWLLRLAWCDRTLISSITDNWMENLLLRIRFKKSIIWLIIKLL
jgi:hypothetical protein